MRELYLKRELFGDSPDKEQTTEDLSSGCRKGSSDQAKNDMQDIEDCKTLDESRLCSDAKVSCLGALIQGKESSGNLSLRDI